MSYDVDIGGCSFNYTSNLARLFYDCIPACESMGGIHELHGKTGRQAAAIIGKAFTTLGEMAYPRDAFREKYDAPNGWGDTTGAIIFLGKILAACTTHPRAKVRICA